MRIVLTGLLAVLMATPVQADEISGDWCGPDGRSLRILGQTVVGPDGTEVPGRYSRHRYEFAMADGVAVVIDQLSEEESMVSFGVEAAVKWTRCRDVTS